MAKHLHKKFSDEHVKSLIQKYLTHESELFYILDILRIKRRRFFSLLRKYREDPERFSISYGRKKSTRKIGLAIEKNIIKELRVEKRLIEDKNMPIRTYNYSYIRDTLFLRGVLYYFERFLQEYEYRFEKEYRYFRPMIKDVVEKYLDCGNPMCGFTCIRCPGCGEERLLLFSCKTRYFCPSCHDKRRKEWSEWIREALLSHFPLIEDDPTYVPSKGWVGMIRKIYEIDPLLCPSCGGKMSIISFIEEPKTIDRIIAYLKLTFEAEQPPPRLMFSNRIS